VGKGSIGQARVVSLRVWTKSDLIYPFARSSLGIGRRGACEPKLSDLRSLQRVGESIMKSLFEQEV